MNSNRTKYVISFFLALVAIYTAWLVQQTRLEDTFGGHADSTHPDAYMKTVVATQIDENGRLHTRLYSPKILHFSKNNSALATTPHVIVYPEDLNKQPWHITAEHGKTLDGSKKIILWENVKIHEPGSAQNQEMTMTTSKLDIYPNKNYVETDKAVTLKEPGTTIHAIGMKGYIKDKRVELLSKVRGEHVEN